MSFYQTLLGVTVKHGYNLGGVCPCLNFVPTENTRDLLDKAGLLLRETADGLQIVYDKSRLEALQMYAQDSQEPLSFDFRVYATDPDFKSYTEPFPVAADDILYFDNRQAKATGEQVLSAKQTVSSEDFRPWDSSDLNALLAPRDRLLPPVFVLRIFAESSQGPLLSQWLDAEPTVYSINFDNRQRYWKYYLLGRMVEGKGADAGFYVVDSDNQVEFETTGEETLSDRKLAYTFRSKQRIPLTEVYQYRFQLKQKGQNGETVVIPSLPFASVRQVGRDTVAEQDTIVSEIYINS